MIERAAAGPAVRRAHVPAVARLPAAHGRSPSPSASAPTPRSSASSTPCCCGRCRFPGADDLVLVTDIEPADAAEQRRRVAGELSRLARAPAQLHRDGGVPPGDVHAVRRRSSRSASPARSSTRTSSTCSTSSRRSARGFAAADERPGAPRVAVAQRRASGGSASAARPDAIGQTRPPQRRAARHRRRDAAGHRLPGQGRASGCRRIGACRTTRWRRRVDPSAQRSHGYFSVLARLRAGRTIDERAGRHGRGRRGARARLSERQPEPRRRC